MSKSQYIIRAEKLILTRSACVLYISNTTSLQFNFLPRDVIQCMYNHWIRPKVVFVNIINI